MRIFRMSMINDKCYIITNVYFYRVIDRNWTPEQSQGVTIHGCMQFLAGILEASRLVLDPVILRALMTHIDFIIKVKLRLLNEKFSKRLQRGHYC